ncbi:unnamed protein product [Lactuca virosa]|uniref:Uncharacterized protein n=1 Tax=Lactuca virosa TaxID=75947 RepID=A0AAU9NTH4_9ASTR|nr:unnamed protein product [Lactuca virosa]
MFADGCSIIVVINNQKSTVTHYPFLYMIDQEGGCGGNNDLTRCSGGINSLNEAKRQHSVGAYRRMYALISKMPKRLLRRNKGFHEANKPTIFYVKILARTRS